MNEYRYNLDKSSRKHHCPSCGKRRFVRYIDSETNNYLPDQYGRCDREDNCTYHIDPYTDGYAKAVWQQENGNRSEFPNSWRTKPPPRRKQPPKPKIYFIPHKVLQSTQYGYERNIFIQNLLSQVPFPFEVSDIEKIISLYQLGTVPDTGAICFPYIDKENRVRAIQEKIFDTENHTDKSAKYYTSWIHSRLKHTTYRNQSLPKWLVEYEKNDPKVTCLFGEHLLSKYPHNPIALVEAPKTAIYGTLYFGFPDEPHNLLWMSVFNLTGLKYQKCKELEGRDVFLFPDLSKEGKAFDLWNDKAKDFQRRMKNTRFIVSDLLERLAPYQDRKQGADIADYLIKHDWKEYRNQRSKNDQIKAPQQTRHTIKREPPPKPKETSTARPKTSQIETSQIEVYELDDLANGIKIPVFAGSPKEYEIFEKKRHANAAPG